MTAATEIPTLPYARVASTRADDLLRLINDRIEHDTATLAECEAWGKAIVAATMLKEVRELLESPRGKHKIGGDDA